MSQLNHVCAEADKFSQWLVLEQWITPDVFNGTNATDQWSFDSTAGAVEKLQSHWSTYFTEADMKQIASWGLNAVRIPIGYWAYNNTGTPYLQGADDFLEKALGWARNAGIKVLIDCHGSPGSQNGFDNSGRSGNVSWQSDDNLSASTSALEQMAAKYGSANYSDVVLGLELVNEPVSWDGNSFNVTQGWAQSAFAAVQAKATSNNLTVFMHDSFEGPAAWEAVGAVVNMNNNTNSTNSTSKAGAKFVIDVHLYQNQATNDSTLTQEQHISEACNWTKTKLLPASSKLPVYVGEFSAVTNVCVNPDGSSLPGNTCTTAGCQCSNLDIQYWNQPLKDATRRFMEAQMDAFEHSSQGWFLWTYKGPGAWGLTNAVQYGLVGAQITDRQFPNQCSFGS